MEVSEFQSILLQWYAEHKRDFPWRNTTNIYRIAVSEFMLQQTQATRVVSLYERFLSRFPTAASLASASQSEVLLYWQGLGYNRRALYVKELASFLVNNPTPTYDELVSNRGVGPYTAAAILAFSQNAPVSAVDVNVSRIFSRLFGRSDSEFISSAVPQDDSRNWHNALMDFGSLVCSKKSPRCSLCPFQSSCIAFANQSFGSEKKSSQKKFVGSLRWHRGQILKALLNKPQTQDELFTSLDVRYRKKEFVSEALAQYVDEGFITQKQKKFIIKQ